MTPPGAAPASGGEVALSEVLGALSYALDITEGEPPGHAVRTTAIGMRLAEQIGLGDEDRSALFYALLLKDAGCSSNAARIADLFAADDRTVKRASKRADLARPAARMLYTWRSVAPGASTLTRARRLRRLARTEAIARDLIGARCERGAEIARMLELPGESAEAIRAQEEHWNGSGHPRGLRRDDIPLLARILCVAQTVEVFIRETGVRGALAMAQRRRGRWFDPVLVDALLALRDDHRFWAPLERPHAVPAAAAWEPAERVLLVSADRLDRVADAFARVIDAKSPFTARHSSGVARWAVLIGRELGFDAEGLRDLRRAGLLHDIGKLTVSNRILDKPGPLSPDEIAVVRQHPRHTQQILARVAGFRGIVETAASHHERLDGSGYHRGLTAAELSRPARILAVADVYEALTADRPYRDALPRDGALEILGAMRGTGLCAECVDALAATARNGGSRGAD